MGDVATDMAGQKVGKWTVLFRAGSAPNKQALWKCRCECGAESIINGSSLRQGGTTRCWSCRNVRHGHAALGRKSTEYTTWATMIRRCEDPAHGSYRNYGGRGISVCDRWQSFDNFIADMGAKPQGATLERLIGDHDYAPTNCRWVSWSVQHRNKRTNRILEFRGKKQAAIVWAEEMGMSPKALDSRLRMGWSVERALTEPVRPSRWSN